MAHVTSGYVGMPIGVVAFGSVIGVEASTASVEWSPGKVGSASSVVTPTSVRPNIRAGSTVRAGEHPYISSFCTFHFVSVVPPVVVSTSPLNSGSVETSCPLALASNVSHLAVTASTMSLPAFGSE